MDHARPMTIAELAAAQGVPLKVARKWCIDHIKHGTPIPGGWVIKIKPGDKPVQGG